MTDDFEVNETGTVKKLCLVSMALKAAIAYLDAVRDGESFHECQNRLMIFLELRKELPDEYQSSVDKNVHKE